MKAWGKAHTGQLLWFCINKSTDLQRTTKSEQPRWLNNFVSSVACLSFAAANSRHYPKAFPSLSVMVQSTMHIAKGFTKSIEEPTKRNMIFQKQPALRRSERKMATMGFAIKALRSHGMGPNLIHAFLAFLNVGRLSLSVGNLSTAFPISYRPTWSPNVELFFWVQREAAGSPNKPLLQHKSGMMLHKDNPKGSHIWTLLTNILITLNLYAFIP